MDKRKTENARVKKQIEEAFFLLLKEKQFSEITVTDIVTEAGVARASYYRNFTSAEDIITGYILRLRQETDDAADRLEKTYGSRFNVQALTEHISYYLKEKHNIILLYENGFGTLMLDETNRCINEAFGNMMDDSAMRYSLYFVSGAIFNTMMQWLLNGAEETPAEISQIIASLLKNLTP